MTKAPIHYMVTMPDGTVPPTAGPSSQYATVNLAEHVGQVVDHPSPGKKWYDVSAFSYFRTYTQRGIGEVLERRGEWPVEWPVRLWIVELLGETGNWGGRHYPYWVLCHQLKVVEETEIWRAFGHRGQQVWDLIDRQLPDLARQWADEWQSDPDGTHSRYDAWNERLSDTHALCCWVRNKADGSRREAAKEVAQGLAVAAAEKAAVAVGAAEDAVAAISRRASCLTAGQLLHDRICRGAYQKSIRALLLGSGLDTKVPALANA
ncbi:hypothetical protein PV381_27775 [Streptomyces scabiei]|uniref:hypothetical protein n=1 Tax=Streptomyces scabiei TaxID=1930 RepID=UPI0029BA3875|nr:hypothetical protein [Streptomyces scabiei]MDX2630295.1 hypothetical protein [Streptomyces scabiei]MDX2630308.1 hypothetical protein [Streptomyces scabiei]